MHDRRPRLAATLVSLVLFGVAARVCAEDAAKPAASAPTSARFVDNGDGTLTDHSTGLMWEKKVVGSGCLHCVEDEHDWTRAMSDWIAEVNGPSQTMQPKTPGLAGHNDWRLPSIDELAAIADCSKGSSCIDPAFGPASAGGYWSASVGIADPPLPAFAWGIDFASGAEGLAKKTTRGHVRAVRRAGAAVTR